MYIYIHTSADPSASGLIKAIGFDSKFKVKRKAKRKPSEPKRQRKRSEK